MSIIETKKQVSKFLNDFKGGVSLRIISVSLRIIGLKTEFLNSFVSLRPQRIISIMVTRVCVFTLLLIFKKIKE